MVNCGAINRRLILVSERGRPSLSEGERCSTTAIHDGTTLAIETCTTDSIAESTATRASAAMIRDDQVHFPDFRIEYDLDGREGDRDVEVLTPHYRGAHAASRGRTGFTCFRVGTGGRSGRWFDPRLAEDLL
jgi:hypothetical protein